MWYKIKRDGNQFKIDSITIDTLYFTLYSSPSCDIEENFCIVIPETEILAGDNLSFTLPSEDGIYKIHITNKEEKEDEILVPQYNVILSSLIKDVEYNICGCNCSNCQDCDGEQSNQDLLTVLFKMLSYNVVNRGKYEKALASSSKCIECEVIEANLCHLLNESVGRNIDNKRILRKLISFYYLVFYYTDFRVEDGSPEVATRYNFKKIYPCIKQLGLDIECIKEWWNNQEEECICQSDVECICNLEEVNNRLDKLEGNFSKSITYFGTKEEVEVTDSRNLDIAKVGDTAIAYEGEIDNPISILDGKIVQDGVKWVGNTFHIKYSTGSNNWDTEDRDEASGYAYSTLYGANGMVLRITDASWREGAIMEFSVVHYDQGDWNSVDRNERFDQISTTGEGQYFRIKVFDVQDGVPSFDFFYTWDSGYFVEGEETTFDINGMTVVLRVDRVSTAQNQVTRFRVLDIGQSDVDFSGVHRFTNPNAPSAWVDMNISAVEIPYTGWVFTNKEYNDTSLVSYNLRNENKPAIVRVDVPNNEIHIAEFGGGSTAKTFIIENPISTDAPGSSLACVMRLKIPVYLSQEFANNKISADVSIYEDGGTPPSEYGINVDINYNGTDHSCEMFPIRTPQNDGGHYSNLYASGFDQETGMLTLCNMTAKYFNSGYAKNINVVVDNVKINGILTPYEFDWLLDPSFPTVNLNNTKYATFKPAVDIRNEVKHYVSNFFYNYSYSNLGIKINAKQGYNFNSGSYVIDFALSGTSSNYHAATIEGRICRGSNNLFGYVKDMKIYTIVLGSNGSYTQSLNVDFVLVSETQMCINITGFNSSIFRPDWFGEFWTDVKFIDNFNISTTLGTQSPSLPSFLAYFGRNIDKEIKFSLMNSTGVPVFVNKTPISTTGAYVVPKTGRLIGELNGGCSVKLNDITICSNATNIPVCIDVYTGDQFIITGTNTGVVNFVPII